MKQEFSVIVEVHTELTVSWAAIEVGGQTLRTIVYSCRGRGEGHLGQVLLLCVDSPHTLQCLSHTVRL